MGILYFITAVVWAAALILDIVWTKKHDSEAAKLLGRMESLYKDLENAISKIPNEIDVTISPEKDDNGNYKKL